MNLGHFWPISRDLGGGGSGLDLGHLEPILGSLGLDLGNFGKSGYGLIQGVIATPHWGQSAQA